MLAAERAAHWLKHVTKDAVINSFEGSLKTHFIRTLFVLSRPFVECWNCHSASLWPHVINEPLLATTKKKAGLYSFWKWLFKLSLHCWKGLHPKQRALTHRHKYPAFAVQLNGKKTTVCWTVCASVAAAAVISRNWILMTSEKNGGTLCLHRSLALELQPHLVSVAQY